MNTLAANLKEKGVVEKGMFAFYLGDEKDGELAIGGYNPDRVDGDINWVNLACPAYWLIGMDQVKFGDTVVTAAQTGGIMDTGTSLIYGPRGQVRLSLLFFCFFFVSLLAILGEIGVVSYGTEGQIVARTMHTQTHMHTHDGLVSLTVPLPSPF